MTNPEAILGGLQEIGDFILRYAVMPSALGARTGGSLKPYKKVCATIVRFKGKALCRWLIDEAPATAASGIAATRHKRLSHPLLRSRRLTSSCHPTQTDNMMASSACQTVRIEKGHHGR